MKRRLILAATAVIAMFLAGSCAKYKYETVKGDPLNTKIYTLDNGLKVYMTVNKETPRVQTYIAPNVFRDLAALLEATKTGGVVAQQARGRRFRSQGVG